MGIGGIFVRRTDVLDLVIGIYTLLWSTCLLKYKMYRICRIWLFGICLTFIHIHFIFFSFTSWNRLNNSTHCQTRATETTLTCLVMYIVRAHLAHILPNLLVPIRTDLKPRSCVTARCLQRLRQATNPVLWDSLTCLSHAVFLTAFVSR